MSTTATLRGGGWLTDEAPAGDLHAGAAHRGAPADRPDGRRVHRRRGAAGARAARAEGLGAGAAAGAALRRARAARHRRARGATAASASTRSSSIIVGEAVGRSASFATTFGAQTGLVDHAAPLFRHRGAEAAISAAAWSPARPIGAYALSESGSGSDALGARARATRAGRRQLPSERREDVDHQRRLRRPLHRLCQGRRRAVHRLHRRARLPRASAPARKSTRWACTARRRRR